MCKLRHLSRLLPCVLPLSCTVQAAIPDAEPDEPASETAEPKEPVEPDGVSETEPAAQPDEDVADAEPAEPFSREFEGLVKRTVNWGGLQVSVTGARVSRGDAPASAWAPEAVFASLDIQIENVMAAETDYRYRDTWDLILADGTRVLSLEPLGVLLSKGDSPTVSMYYPVDEDTELSGAALELNGSSRDSFEPLQLKLDGDQEAEIEYELTQAIGQVFEPQPEASRTLRFEVTDARFGKNLFEFNSRAARGTQLLALGFKVTYFGPFSEAFDADLAPKVSFNGSTHPSYYSGAEVIDAGEPAEFILLYHVDEDVTEFDLVFDTRDGEVHRFGVKLSEATIVHGDESED